MALYYEDKPTIDTLQNHIMRASVIRVIDGDTIEACGLEPEDTSFNVRFIGVNCPETSGNQYQETHSSAYSITEGLSLDEARAIGEKAKEFTKSILEEGSIVVLDLSVLSKTDGEIVFATDIYNRRLAVVYTDEYNSVNVNRSLIESNLGDVMNMNSGHVSVSSWTTHKKRKPEVVDPTVTSINYRPQVGYNSNLNLVEPMENERMPRDNRPPGYMLIGDVELAIPPQAITVTRQSKINKVPVLRSKSSIQTKTGFSDIAVQVELFFHNKDYINGYPVKGNDGSTFYVNGLRPLVSQFKKSPFVPIQNDYLEEVHGVESVTLVNMTAQTVPGFPDCIVVNITMLKFDHQAYMPYTDDFYDSFCWPLFRWYCQGPMNERSADRIYLKPLDGSSTDLVFRLANESNLMQIKQEVAELLKSKSKLDMTYPDSNTLWSKINSDGEGCEEAFMQQEAYEKIAETWPSGVIKDVSVDELTGIQDSKMEDIRFQAPGVYVKRDPMYYTKRRYRVNITAYQNIELLKANGYGEPSNGWYVIDVEDKHLLDTIADRYETQQDDFAEKLDDLKQRQQRIENAEENILMDELRIKGLVVESIHVGLENIISSMQIQQCEASTHQYLGSQDAYIQISMTSVGKEPVKNLVKMIRDAERYTRDYKFGMVCGYLGINNPIVNLFGVRYTLVENVTVNTVRGFPDRYEIVLTLIGFDKTQRRSERLKSLNTGEGVNLNNVKSFYGMEEVIVEERLKNIEVYPDLELPTWDELKTFTTKANINYIFPQEAGWSAGKFVDPDFFIYTPHTLRKDLRDMINKEEQEKDEKKAGMDIKCRIGTASLRVPTSLTLNENETYQPLYKVSDELKKYSEAKIKEDLELNKKYGKAKQEQYKNDISNIDADEKPPVKINGDSSESAINVDIMQYRAVSEPNVSNKSMINYSPTENEINRWFKGHEEEGEYFASHIGVNPDEEAVARAIESEVDHLLTGTDMLKEPAVLWMKAIITQESRSWLQFINKKPYWNEEGSSAVGLGQYMLDQHGLTLETARRIAWDWKYNIHVCTKYYIEKIIAVTKLKNPKYSEDIYGWAVVAYNKGNVDDLTAPSSWDYYTKVKKWYEKFKSAGSSSTRSEMLGTKYTPPTTGVHADYPSEVEDQTEGKMSAANSPTKINFSPHEPQIDNNKIVRDSFTDMLETDHRGRLLRAFPSFQMLLIDEGRWVSWIKLWDNFYGFNSIQSIDIIKSRKIAADTCVIRMTNVYDNLTRYDMNLEYPKYDQKYEWNELFFGQFNHQSLIDARKEYVSALYLQTGARIHLRMGYGSNAQALPIMFNGSITELDSGGDIIEIVAQGDGLELCNQIGGEPDKLNDGSHMNSEARSTLCYLMARHNNPVWNWIEQVINQKEPDKQWLWNLFDRPENPLGITHFGNPRDFPFPEGKLDSLLPWKRDEKLGEIAANIYTSTGTGVHSQWIWDPYSLVAQDSLTEDAKNDLYQGWYLHWGVPFPKGDEDNIVVPLFGKTVWDVAQTLAVAFPDYIATVVPMEFRSTLFYGRPHWPICDRYAWNYKWDPVNKKYDRTATEMISKPLCQIHTYFSWCDIIANNIKASEEGVYTNVIASYKTKSGVPKSSMVVHADEDIYPEKQKTAVINVDFLEHSYFNFGDTNAKRFANTAAAQTLRDFVKDMYKGELTVIGDPSIKPHDMCYIADEVNEMHGMCGVKQVVHHLSHDTGFVTNICPDAIVIVDDKMFLNYVNWASTIVAGSTANIAGHWAAIGAWRKLTGSSLGAFARRTTSSFGELGLEMLVKATGNNWVLNDIMAEGADIYKMEKNWSKVYEYFKNVKINRSLRSAAYSGKYGNVVEGYDKMKTFLQTAKTGRALAFSGRSIAMVARLALSPFGIATIAEVGLTILADSIFEAYKRQKRNRQAIIVVPLRSHGKNLVAGLNGHQGCVIGDKPSKMDLFWEGKGKGAGSGIPRLFNELTGDDYKFSHNTEDHM